MSVSNPAPPPATDPPPATGTPIFILGDSRTGTLTLHRFFQALGYRAIHYFVKDSEQIDPDHEHHAENWERLSRYVDASEYQAFSDYPTRLFYRELVERYPSATFVLTVRKDTPTWQRSMTRFFSKAGMELDIVALSRAHETINAQIRELCATRSVRFLEVCIDDDPDENAARIKRLLGLESDATFGWENRTDAYDLSLLSTRAVLYGPGRAEHPVLYTERVCGDAKTMLSEHGWLWLVNDTNRYLYYFYGLDRWTNSQREKAYAVIDARCEVFNRMGIEFRMFLIPDKPAIYPEYLPRCFEGLVPADSSPPLELSRHPSGRVHHLGEFLRDAKSYGLLFFRGDTHTNWLGGYFTYLHVAEVMNRNLGSLERLDPLSLDDLLPSVAGYDGDLLTQAPRETLDALAGPWRPVHTTKTFEQLLQYRLHPDRRRAHRVGTPEEYTRAFQVRETFVYEGAPSLPRAVVFRDSFSDFVVDYLAQHFSRSVFVWHKGQVFVDVVERERPDVVLHLQAERVIQSLHVQETISRALYEAGE